jgi:putative ABC transport system ATP-binding protein
MSLLRLDAVSKRYTHGHRRRVALHDVSLSLEAGELVAVWGSAGSGRTTLLRVASGLERPDAGRVWFDGVEVGVAGRAEALLGDEIAYVQTRMVGPQRQPVLDRLTVALVARGTSPAGAADQVAAALERVAATECATLTLGELDAAEAVRVGIAQALVLAPRLIVVDEPTAGVALRDREGILALLRSIADAGAAILMTAGEAIALSGVDRALTISAGRLRADVAARSATVVPLRRPG